MIHILPARECDIEGIARLERTVFPDAWSHRSIEGAVHGERVTVLAAVEGDRVLAYLIYYHIINEGEIARLAVDPAYRRRRIAHMLLDRMIERGEEEHLTEYSLEVREGNRAAIALYESFSFAEEGRRKHYYHAPDEDALIMWRRKNKESYA